MDEPARRLKNLLEAAGGAAAPEYARLRVQALPRSRSAVAYYELGDPHGVPLLCLHGLSVSGWVFDRDNDHFAAKGIRAIAPCLLGGIHLRNPSRTIAKMTGELIELMDVLDEPRFDVLGFSWGTLPQLDLLVRAPDRVRRAGFVGPMLPTRFLSPRDIDRLKPDVRASLAMSRRAPALHRGLMSLVGLLPVSFLLRQFDDDQLSTAERAALAPGAALRADMARWIEECRRGGSGFYTDGWRMMQDAPGYALSSLALAAPEATVRLYIGEHDNVHLPVFADMIAAAHRGIDVGAVDRTGPSGVGVFRSVFTQGRTHILIAPGAGRMACLLYLREALDDLMSCAPAHQPLPASQARASRTSAICSAS